MRKFALALFLTLLVPGLGMPSVYNTQVPPPLLVPGGAVVPVWNAETPTPGNGTTAASQQVIIYPDRNLNGTPFSVDGYFSAAPGAFEIDVQVAATDSDTKYQTISGGAITSVDATNQTFHPDAPYTTARYVRLLMRSRTNSVAVTGSFTR